MSKIYKKAFITGATKGIGESLARALSQRGVELLLSGRDQSKLEVLQKELPNTEVVVCELAEREARQSLFQKARGCDLWINNAGFGVYGKFTSLEKPEVTEMLEVNVAALTESTHEAIRYFSEEKIEGTILNISSAAAFYPFPHSALYAATKAFVLSFSESLDFEWKKENIRILTSCPGMVDTDFQKRASRGKGRKNTPLTMQLPEVTQSILNQLDKGKGVSVISWKYLLLTKLYQYFLPKSLAAKTIQNNLTR